MPGIDVRAVGPHDLRVLSVFRSKTRIRCFWRRSSSSPSGAQPRRGVGIDFWNSGSRKWSGEAGRATRSCIPATSRRSRRRCAEDLRRFREAFGDAAREDGDSPEVVYDPQASCSARRLLRLPLWLATPPRRSPIAFPCTQAGLVILFDAKMLLRIQNPAIIEGRDRILIAAWSNKGVRGQNHCFGHYHVQYVRGRRHTGHLNPAVPPNSINVATFIHARNGDPRRCSSTKIIRRFRTIPPSRFRCSTDNGKTWSA